METKENNILREPELEWGGKWTEQKLDAFIAYVKAYLKIMNKNPFWQTIYFDGFAGAGEKIKSNKEELLIPFEKDLPEELNIYQGSVKRVLEERENQFDFYYFIDRNEANIKSIDKIKNSITYINKKKIVARLSDCNIELPKLAEVLKRKKHAALVFVDPFGMQINWEAIASLKGTRSDIWILIPSGVAINRLLPRSGIITNSNKLEKFFGLSIEEVKKIFYLEKKEKTFFGELNSINKIEKPIERISELYKSQLQTVWKFVSKRNH